MRPLLEIRSVEESRRRNIVHVQSVLLQSDAVALKVKTGESNIKDAITDAVYHYLKCHKTDECA